MNRTRELHWAESHAGDREDHTTSNLLFDGPQTYIEVPDSADFSLATSGGLTISAWMRPDVLTFSARMYRADTTAPANTNDPQGPTRSGRISFYVFNLDGGLGVGSYFQDALMAGTWIHVVGAADATNAYLYRDGLLRKTEQYAPKITPAHGSASLRIGTRDFKSFFQGAIREVGIWSRCLQASEVAALHDNGVVPQAGLVAE